MLDTQNRQIARTPATKEFDEKMSKMYEKVYREVSKLSRKAVANYELNIDQLLMPTSTESEDAKVAQKFTRAKLKILSSVNQLVKMLVAGRNRVSLFDMFDPNEQNGKRFAKKYNRIKMTALGRLESGVGLMKFTDMHELPLATMLFPTPNTKLYTGRYELLKHKMLSKVNKGIRNITFVAPKKQPWKFWKIEKSKAEVPIDSFLMPSANSQFYTIRYNLAKHRMLSKVNKGIRNITFVAPGPGPKHVTGKLTRWKPLQTKVDVPIDSFIMPVGNDPIYIARYAGVKHKLLSKIKKGISSMDFTGQSFNIMDKFMPSDGVNGDDLTSAVSKALAKSINRESKQRANATKRASKTNEFQVHKREKRLDEQFRLDMERNEILMSIFNGGYGAASGKGFSGATNTKYNKKTNTFAATAAGSGVGTAVASLGPMMKKSLPAITKALGAGILVAGSAVAGYKIGEYLDTKFSISDKIAKSFGYTYDWFADKDLQRGLEHIKGIGVANALGAEMDPLVLNAYKANGGGATKTPSQNRAILDEAKAAAASTRVGPAGEINFNAPETYTSATKNEALMQELLWNTNPKNNIPASVQTTIVNPRANSDFVFSTGALDQGL